MIDGVQIARSAFRGGALMRSDTERGACLQGEIGRRLDRFELERLKEPHYKQLAWYHRQTRRAYGEVRCCPTCGGSFPPDREHFHSTVSRMSKANPLGLYSECKTCHNARQRVGIARKRARQAVERIGKYRQIAQ